MLLRMWSKRTALTWLGGTQSGLVTLKNHQAVVYQVKIYMCPTAQEFHCWVFAQEK